MIEFLIPCLVAGALSGLGMMLWRSLRGSAQQWHAALRLFIVILVSFTLVTLSTWQLIKSRHVQLFGELITHVETSEAVVALTFDDGPFAGETDKILKILETEGVRATFFVTGKELAENQADGQRIVAAGHELGNHTYSHRVMVGVSYQTVKKEIEQTDTLIRAAGYEGPIYVRPPYGKRLITLPYYLKMHQRKTIYWDVEPESYADIAAHHEIIETHVLDNVKPGSIILLHGMGDSRLETRRALPGIIDGLHERGYQLVTLSELLNDAPAKATASPSPPLTEHHPSVVEYPEVEVKPELEAHFQGFRGGFLLYDFNNDLYIRYNPERCGERLLPASTFKIINSLIALETGVAPGENYIIPWDGTPYELPAWNQDHTLKTAIRDSVVWYYQELARQIGAERMQSYVSAIGYGNQDISGDIDIFWLEGALRISINEQVEILKRLYQDDLPFSPETMATVKEILLLEETTSYRLYGKTGSVQRATPHQAWFVGYLERDGNVYVFATNYESATPDGPASGYTAMEMTRNILQALEVLP